MCENGFSTNPAHGTGAWRRERRKVKPGRRKRPGSRSSTERAGFDSSENRKSLVGLDFDLNTINTKEFGPSGHSRSLPVVPGPGGADPGQNRDKSPSRFQPDSVLIFVMICAVALLAMAAGNLGSPRPESESERERKAKLKRTWDEVRELVAEYHGRLPREHAAAIGAAYARYSTRGQDSVVDQIRTILDDALRKKIYIPLEHVFFDLGVRGAKAHRPGLDGLRGVLQRRARMLCSSFPPIDYSARSTSRSNSSRSRLWSEDAGPSS